MIRILFAAIVLSLFSIPSIQAESWPGEAFAVVKAYQYDPPQASQEIVEHGRINKSAKGGKSLNPGQIKALLAAVQGSHPEHERARCFTPHHGFVLFDKEGKIVAHLSVCFTCGTYRGQPEGTAQNWDLPTLRKIFLDLSLL